MFTITSISLPPGKTASIAQVRPVQAPVNIGDVMGPQGAQYVITIPGMGVINLLDIGDTVRGPATWGVQINGAKNWFYEGGGQMAITIDIYGNVTVSGGAGTGYSNILVQGPSITIDQNWGTYTWYVNPNIYAGDINGNPVTPQTGVECHLWANVQNNGTIDTQAVNATFYLLLAGGGLVWPESAHGSNSIPALSSGATQLIMCSIPWIPDSTVDAHQCIVGVVSCLDCPAPPAVPGTQVPIEGSNTQVGQHNVTISMIAGTYDSTTRYFYIMNLKNPGYVQITREPLSKHAAALKSRGIDPKIPEAPKDEKLNIVRQIDCHLYGERMDFKAGEKHDLYTKVDFNEIKPGTAAIYNVQHFENDKLAGGVMQIILHK